MIYKKLKYKIIWKWMKLRLQPIRVYCLHHVCTSYDAETMYEGDWMALNLFQAKIKKIQQSGVVFLSLSEAYKHMRNDFFRRKKYAVLSFDDGYASLKEVLPWLKAQHIPVTLFVNSDYACGKAYRENAKETYLTLKELSDAQVEIGMHGLQHVDATKMTSAEFRIFVEESIKATQKIDGYIPFWAYTWGRHNEMTDILLQSKNIIPVYMDGMKNYREQQVIHRELF